MRQHSGSQGRGAVRRDLMDEVPRGRLKVYLGAAPGGGKTYRMLDEGRRRAGRGADVGVAFAVHDA